MIDWSQLPYDLIVLVANKLIDVVDFLAFSAVCRSWRVVYLNKSWFPSHHIPWLMSVEYTEGGGMPVRQFFSLVQFKVYRVRLPESYGCRCWDSSHGWIVTVNQDLTICLVNPLTRACLPLPEHPMLKNQSHPGVHWCRTIQKAVVLKVRDELVMMMIHSEFGQLSFAKPGDSAWTDVPFSLTDVPFSIPIFLVNIVCFKDQVLALTLVGTLVHVEMEGLDGPRVLRIASPPHEKYWQHAYLVESSENLLLVIRYSHKFKVYKFDTLNKQWIALDDLGNNVLLVDDYRCVSVSVSGCGFLKPNCIYFAQDYLASPGVPSQLQQRKLIVCNFKDGSTDVHQVQGSHNSCFGYPVWTAISLW